ncbi:MAG: phosphodiesterase [Prochloraceae cyanobacterium]|nr:phosphodiesterase [Prochloraceae cyanobacterium]
MIIVQITDLHIYAPDKDKNYPIDTAANLIKCIERINNLVPRPDLVLATGDLVQSGNKDEYDRLKSILDLLEIPYFLIPGNHDDRNYLKAVFDDHKYLQNNEEFCHYVIEDYPLRLIGLDSIEPGKVGGKMCQKRYAWLSDRLSEAPDRPTLLFLHHPPFNTGFPEREYEFAEVEKFQKIVVQNHQIVKIVSGHFHRGIETKIGNSSVSVCPSTAYTYSLSFLSHKVYRTEEPPGYQLHLWNSKNQTIISNPLFF